MWRCTCVALELTEPMTRLARRNSGDAVSLYNLYIKKKIPCRILSHPEFLWTPMRAKFVTQLRHYIYYTYDLYHIIYYTHRYMHTYVHIYIYAHTYIYIYIYTYICTLLSTGVNNNQRVELEHTAWIENQWGSSMQRPEPNSVDIQTIRCMHGCAQKTAAHQETRNASTCV